MFCIIYKSTLNPTVEHSEVIDLLKKAKVFNRKHDITGCLLLYNDTFVQYIEGEESVVTNLYERIKKDERHFNVELISKGHISSREFDDWSMAYENLMKSNYRLAYLKILVSSYFENPKSYENLNLGTNKFWNVVKTLLTSQKTEKLE